MPHNLPLRSLIFISAALKFFRTCIGLQDEFYNRQITKSYLFEPILNVVYDTMPRDNLLNSACLELFEFIKRENIKPIIIHLVENYRVKLQIINYVDTFETLILRYDQMKGYSAEMDSTLFSQDEGSQTPQMKVNGNQRWQGVKEMDPTEEEYFNTSDDEDELSAKAKPATPITNGTTPLTKPLVDYPDDDDDELTDSKGHIPLRRSPTEEGTKPIARSEVTTPRSMIPIPQTPPERLSEKRRREEDEEDELGKLSYTKRRSSSISSVTSAKSTNGNPLRRKQSFTTSKDSPTGKKIAISLAVKNPIETEHGHDEGR